MAKVAILGAGMVGTATATYLAERNLADLVFIDVVNRGLAEGKAVDLAAASAVRGFSVRISGTDEVEAAAGADVIVSTAGVPRKPGMDRMDLLRQNGEIARRLGEAVARHAPGSVFINVANPLDVLCHIFLETMKFPRERVFGMAGVLDSTRFRTFLAEALDCDPRDVAAMVLGGHGDSMVPLLRTATVSGVPVTELLDGETLEAIVERTRRAGAEVVRLLQTGSAFLSTGAAAAQMVEAVLTGRPRLLPVSARLEGEYGMHGFHLGVPAVIGASGIRRIVEVDLTEEERTALAASAGEIQAGIRAWEGAGT